jgi:hypothetical protein
MASSTTATVTDALWGSTPMSTLLMRERTSVPVRSLPSAFGARDTPTLSRSLSYLF